MNLQDIQPVLIEIENNLVVGELRAHTYLSTYPDIIAFCESAKESNNINETQFRQLALLVYGWMPRVLRISPNHLEDACLALNKASQITNAGRITAATIQSIADCLHSVVGASKMLHFINPNIFPMWDSNIQAFRGFPNDQDQMGQVQNYLGYVREVHAIIIEPEFDEFYCQYKKIHSRRLYGSNIEEYTVGKVRAIEGSAFELARHKQIN